MFSKVLVANRGEIAIRVCRTLREMEIASVAIYSEEDHSGRHLAYADEAWSVGDGDPVNSYLDGDEIIQICRQSGAEAIHPGYGFLAENAGFARACEDAGIVFIGPSADVIETSGLKTEARAAMTNAGVPVINGTASQVPSVATARRLASHLGYPILVKAAAGGGGRGIRVARREDELEQAFEEARSEAGRFFGNDDVYLERYLENPRHIEVQIVADRYGGIVHLGERECSTQRRHQKIIEEAPAPRLDDALRAHIHAIALRAARALRYSCVGTVEGLLADGQYYFLELNCRLQVEHPVTEMVTGVDLVREQILIAAGFPLAYDQKDLMTRGVALECRINAEAPHKMWTPAPGRITRYHEPGGPGVRVDSGVGEDVEVSRFYDSLLAKLIVWDTTRERATSRMLRALHEYKIEGLDTLIPFHVAFLQTSQWTDGDITVNLLGDQAWLNALRLAETPPIEAGGEPS